MHAPCFRSNFVNIPAYSSLTQDLRIALPHTRTKAESHICSKRGLSTFSLLKQEFLDPSSISSTRYNYFKPVWKYFTKIITLHNLKYTYNNNEHKY